MTQANLSAQAVSETNIRPGAVERLSPMTRRVVAPNPSPYTYTGTCSYIVGDGEVAIIDPGPDDARHVENLLKEIDGETLRYILVTHTHRDHSPAARLLRERTGAQVVGCAPYAPLVQNDDGTQSRRRA